MTKLQYEPKSCHCGKAYGYYKPGGVNVSISGTGICIGISSSELLVATQMLEDHPDMTFKATFALLNFRAWIFHPNHSSNIEFKP